MARELKLRGRAEITAAVLEHAGKREALGVATPTRTHKYSHTQI